MTFAPGLWKGMCNFFLRAKCELLQLRGAMKQHSTGMESQTIMENSGLHSGSTGRHTLMTPCNFNQSYYLDGGLKLEFASDPDYWAATWASRLVYLFYGIFERRDTSSSKFKVNYSFQSFVVCFHDWCPLFHKFLSLSLFIITLVPWAAMRTPRSNHGKTWWTQQEKREMITSLLKVTLNLKPTKRQ